MTDVPSLKRRIEVARRAAPADLVLKGGRVFNLVTGRIERADVAIVGDVIVAVGAGLTGRRTLDCRGKILAPGFVDAHLHVESSLLTPPEFARCVLPRGTTSAIADPHEIANVLGAEGVRYFIDSAAGLPLDLRIMLPSCVPATELETSGARLDAADLAMLRDAPPVLGLAEMMNMPGLLCGDETVLEKLAAFAGGPIDGHAPLMRGADLDAYLAAGVRTCHESTTLDEAAEKLAKGMIVLMREGGVAKNLAELAPLLTERTSPFIGLCTDDRTPLDIAEEGHVDHGVRLAIKRGVPPLAAYRAASWSVANAYGLKDRGLVAPGFRADLVLLGDVEGCAVEGVVAGGQVVDADLLGHIPAPPLVGLDSMRLAPVTAETFRTPAAGPSGPVIGLSPGSLITQHLTLALPYADGCRHPDAAADIQKLVVLCRHGRTSIGRAFVKGFGLARGAIASSVGHDSHNVIVIGLDDADMALAVNRLIALGGGFVAAADGHVLAELALPVAGLMSDRPFGEVCTGLKRLIEATHALGCRLDSPFLQLAFLPLPVIPHLKLTDKGLVDVDRHVLLTA